MTVIVKKTEQSVLQRPRRKTLGGPCEDKFLSHPKIMLTRSKTPSNAKPRHLRTGARSDNSERRKENGHN